MAASRADGDAAERRVLLPLLADRERKPERVSRDHRGQGQMRGEFVLAYGDAVAADEAARHHEPAERSLRPAQNEQREDLRNEWLGMARRSMK